MYTFYRRFRLGCIVWGVGAASLLRAQIVKTSMDGMVPPALTFGAPAGSYALSGFESVNLFNGNLNFALPVLEIGGRGEAKYTVTVKVERKWNMDKNPASSTAPESEYHLAPNQYGGFAFHGYYGPAYMMSRRGATLTPCTNSNAMTALQVLTRYSLVAADGTETELRYQQNDGLPLDNTNATTAPCGQTQPRGTIVKASDASGITFVANHALTEWANAVETDPGTEAGGEFGYAVFKSGVRYEFDGPIQRIVDRNGNTIRFEYTADLLTQGAVKFEGKITLTFKTPSGENCSCTSERTLSNGKGNGAAYTLTTTQPVVKPVEQKKRP